MKYRGPGLLCVLLVLLGLLFFIIGFSTNGWLKGPWFENGLWQTCRYSRINTLICIQIKGMGWRWQMVQIVECITLVTYTWTTIMTVLQLKVSGAQTMAIASAAFTAILILVSSVTFLVLSLERPHGRVHYSFILTVLSAVFIIAHACISNNHGAEEGQTEELSEDDSPQTNDEGDINVNTKDTQKLYPQPATPGPSHHPDMGRGAMELTAITKQ